MVRQRNGSTPAVCGCGHTRSGHYRETGVCRKVLCPCSSFRVLEEQHEAPDPPAAADTRHG